MIPRAASFLVEQRLADYPAVALVGPRQCGKTTLAMSFDGRYFDLEQESDRLRLDIQWPDLLPQQSLVVLDEAQTEPDLFPRLRGAIDQDRKRNGRFLMLGSVSPALMTQVSESLAGRLSLVELTPFSLSELPTDAARGRLWWCGGFPDGGVLTPHRYPQWQSDYLALLTQRDLPAWGLQAKPQLTERLLRMLAANHGQVWNASKIGQSLGVSYHTVNEYCDYLEGAFLIRRLQPYFANIGKRLVKSPKLYWRDSGLLHSVLNVADSDALLGQPWVGASWEGFVIEQILTAMNQHGVSVHPFFFRTSDQHEIDLLLDFGKEVWAVEVKLTTSPSPHDLQQLNRTADLIGAKRRFLVSQTREDVEGENCTSCSLAWLLEWVKDQLA